MRGREKLASDVGKTEEMKHLPHVHRAGRRLQHWLRGRLQFSVF